MIRVMAESDRTELCSIEMWPDTYMKAVEVVRETCNQLARRPIVPITLEAAHLCLRDPLGMLLAPDYHVRPGDTVHVCAYKEDSSRQSSMPHTSAAASASGQECDVYIDETLVPGGLYLKVPRARGAWEAIAAWCVEIMGFPQGDYVVDEHPDTLELVLKRVAPPPAEPLSKKSTLPSLGTLWTADALDPIDAFNARMDRRRRQLFVILPTGVKCTVDVTALGMLSGGVFKCVFPVAIGSARYYLVDVFAEGSTVVKAPVVLALPGRTYLVVDSKSVADIREAEQRLTYNMPDPYVRNI